MIKTIAAVIFSLVVAAGPALAATVTADGQQSSVMFRINHDLGYTVGYFDDFSATLEVGGDPAQISAAKIQVETASITTRNAVRDEGLKSTLFLDAGQFPQAIFESATIEGDQMSGLLTIKGVAHPVTFKIEQDGGKTLLKGTINRNDFGVNYNRLLPNKKKAIGETVDLIIELKQ